MLRGRGAEIWLSLVLLLGVVVFPTGSWAHSGSEGTVEGLVDVPLLGALGGNLALPFARGAPPVTIHVRLGIPTGTIPVKVTAATEIETEEGLSLPVTLTDGDCIKVEFVVVGTEIQAAKLELGGFPEIEAHGTVSDVPSPWLHLPLPAVASPVTIMLSLVSSGGTFPIVLTGSTKVTGGSFVLVDGAEVKIQAILSNGQVVVTEIELEH